MVARPTAKSKSKKKPPAKPGMAVAELFAGVGGFRLGLAGARGGGWSVIWSNQWEPGARRQWASECYVSHFGPDGHVCDDIAKVLDDYEAGAGSIPDVDLLVGGFPCQDYSVAKPLNQSEGIVGKKGVLWWQIHRFLELKARRGRAPRFLLLENVDRLLKSPASQRGRDFAVMLACLGKLGYEVEWRVVNAAEYGFPQRRRRVFIVATLGGVIPADGHRRIATDGILAKALPCQLTVDSGFDLPLSDLTGPIDEVSRTFGRKLDTSPFQNAGFMRAGQVWTAAVIPKSKGRRKVLADVLDPASKVASEFFIDSGAIPEWKYLKGAKNEPRIHKGSGARYFYTEGALPFPDPIDRPARTILTGEGGSSPSRFRHIIQTASGRYRRLTPTELERLNGFPAGWTDSGMPDSRRAFCMGNALVVGVVSMIGKQISRLARAKTTPRVSTARRKRPRAA